MKLFLFAALLVLVLSGIGYPANYTFLQSINGTEGAGSWTAFSFPSNVYIGPSGKLYVMDTINGKIHIYNSNLTRLDIFGSQGTGEREFNLPNAVAEFGGKLYVADTGNNRIRIFGQGNVLQKSILDLDGPKGIAVDSSGNIYVSNSGADRILVYDANAVLARTFGTGGFGDGNFRMPNGLFIKGDRIYIVDSGNNRVEVYSLNFTLLGRVGMKAGGELAYPTGVWVDNQDNVYVASTTSDEVVVFDSNYNPMLRIRGSGNYILNSPEGVAVDAQGRIFVADTLNSRLLVFKFTGTAYERSSAELKITEAEDRFAGADALIKDANVSLSRVVSLGCKPINNADTYLSSAEENYGKAVVDLMSARIEFARGNYSRAYQYADSALGKIETAKSDANSSRTYSIQTVNLNANAFAQLEAARNDMEFFKSLNSTARLLGISTAGTEAYYSSALGYFSDAASKCAALDYAGAGSKAALASREVGKGAALIEPVVNSSLRDSLFSLRGRVTDAKARARNYSISLNVANIESLLDGATSSLNLRAYSPAFTGIGNASAALSVAENQLSSQISSLLTETSLLEARLSSLETEFASFSAKLLNYRQENLAVSVVSDRIDSARSALSAYSTANASALVQEAENLLASLKANYTPVFSKIDDALSALSVANSTIESAAGNHILWVIYPNFQQARAELLKAGGKVYSAPEEAKTYALNASSLAISENKRVEEMKPYFYVALVAGVLVILLFIAAAIGAIHIGRRMARRRREAERMKELEVPKPALREMPARRRRRARE